MREGDGKDDELERLLDSLARVASGSVAEDGGAGAVAEPSPKQTKMVAAEDKANALFGSLPDA